MSEILRRQKILIEDLIGTESECFVVCGRYNERPQTAYKKRYPLLAEFLTFNSKSIPYNSFETDREPDELFQIAFGKRKILFK